MKKILILATSALLITGASFAADGGKKGKKDHCAKGKTCGKSCGKSKTASI